MEDQKRKNGVIEYLRSIGVMEYWSDWSTPIGLAFLLAGVMEDEKE